MRLKPEDLKIVADDFSMHEGQQIRISLMGGGPGGMEVIIDANKASTRLTVWNPLANKWVTLAEVLNDSWALTPVKET